MGAWASNLNQARRDSRDDEGAWQDIQGIDLNTCRDEAGLLLTGATSPVLALASDFLSVSWAAANVDAMYLRTRIPREAAYKISKAAATINIPYLDLRLCLWLRMAAAAGPDTPAIAVTAVARAASGALKATFTAGFMASFQGGTATNAVPNSTNPTPFHFTFFEKSGTGPVYLAPDDELTIKIVPAAHGTDALHLWGVNLRCRTNAGWTDRSLRV